MPAQVMDEPLGIECQFSDGTTLRKQIGPTDNDRLARDLLVGLTGLVHPHGQIDAAATISHYTIGVRAMIAFMTERGFTGSAASLTRPQLAEFWMGCTPIVEQTTRRMLMSLHEQMGALSADAVGLTRGRAFHPARNRDKKPFEPYSVAEWTRLHAKCRDTVATAFSAYKKAMTAGAGEDPKTGGWTRQNARWLVRTRGPMTLAEAGEHMGYYRGTIAAKGGLGDVRDELFPNPDVVLCYQLLFGIYTGIVPDGIADLGVGDIDWAGDGTVLLDYVKGRTSKESLTLPSRAVRLLERWLEHSSLLRTFAPPAMQNQLWIRYVPGPSGPWLAGAVSHYVSGMWTRRAGLLGDDGAPLRLHRHRIRTSFESLRDRRAWHGSSRATIDPNHSPRVEGDNYLTATTPQQRDAVEGVIETAQGDLLRKAQPPTLLTADQAADAAAAFPGAVKALRLDQDALAELLGGERDVFLASCADQLAGQFGPVGKPCPARPWVCLLCPLAMFAPRHAANLLRMKAFFGRQWRQMPADHFMAVFGPYANRVDEVVAALDRHDPTLIARYSREVHDTDHELTLRPEELTA